MKKTTFILTLATFFVMSTSFSQTGNTIDDAIPLDGNSINADFLNLGPANNSGFLPQCQTTPDIFFKHTVSTGDNRFVYGMATSSAAVTNATIHYQLFKAPNGNMEDLEEVTCDSYNVVASAGGVFQTVIEYVVQGDEYYLRLFKPAGIADSLLVALANLTTASMVSSYDSTLSNGLVEKNNFKVTVKNSTIHLYNNSEYKHFSVFAIDGKRVMSQNSIKKIETIDISTLNRGLYILLIQNEGASLTQKFVKN